MEVGNPRIRLAIVMLLVLLGLRVLRAEQLRDGAAFGRACLHLVGAVGLFGLGLLFFAFEAELRVVALFSGAATVSLAGSIFFLFRALSPPRQGRTEGAAGA
ncbi:MAG: hypothetical protein KatS3mg102_2469 [Planctomycetota bacterium]|nr:MAG: hypothetical protein KatS3mg102_2469 [Planctomycetota bacterium]